MTDKKFNVAAIVLAAGKSRRMGGPKMVLPFGKSTIVGSVVNEIVDSLASSCTVVLGYYGVEVREALKDYSVRFAANSKPDMGMLSSVQAGIRVLDEADGYMICLGDQPQISAKVINELIAAAIREGSGLYLPVFEGGRGHPLLFTREFRDEIMSLPLTVGLNTLLERHSAEVKEVPVDEQGITADIDTPEDYERLTGQIPIT